MTIPIRAGWAALGLALLMPVDASAGPAALDRAVVRFTAPETGGTRAPRFVFERVLAFEARLEALSDSGYRIDPDAPYRDRHVRAALERHIAETLLASLRITPEPSEADLSRQARAARLVLAERVGSVQALDEAARAEGISDSELLGMLRRQARASLYLDRMVAPMLRPSEPELRAIHRTVATPYRDQPFERVSVALGRWYVARRMAVALVSFYQNAQSRLTITLL